MTAAVVAQTSAVAALQFSRQYNKAVRENLGPDAVERAKAKLALYVLILLTNVVAEQAALGGALATMLC